MNNIIDLSTTKGKFTNLTENQTKTTETYIMFIYLYYKYQKIYIFYILNQNLIFKIHLLIKLKIKFFLFDF